MITRLAINSHYARFLRHDYVATGWSSARPSHSDSSEAYQPKRTRKGSSVKEKKKIKKKRKGRRKRTREAWREEYRRGGGRKHAALLHASVRCAYNRRPPKIVRKTPRRLVRSPLWTNFLLFVARPDRIYAPDNIYLRFFFERTCNAFTVLQRHNVLSRSLFIYLLFLSPRSVAIHSYRRRPVTSWIVSSREKLIRNSLRCKVTSIICKACYRQAFVVFKETILWCSFDHRLTVNFTCR